MSDLVQVWSSGDSFEAELMRGRLESEGISVLLKGSGESEAYPVGPVYLFVANEDEAKARVVIDAVNSGAYAITDEDVDQARVGGEVADDAGADEGGASGEA